MAKLRHARRSCAHGWHVGLSRWTDGAQHSWRSVDLQCARKKRAFGKRDLTLEDLRPTETAETAVLVNSATRHTVLSKFHMPPLRPPTQSAASNIIRSLSTHPPTQTTNSSPNASITDRAHGQEHAAPTKQGIRQPSFPVNRLGTRSDVQATLVRLLDHIHELFRRLAAPHNRRARRCLHLGAVLLP